MMIEQTIRIGITMLIFKIPIKVIFSILLCSSFEFLQFLLGDLHNLLDCGWMRRCPNKS